jgi:hypothetical protein
LELTLVDASQLPTYKKFTLDILNRKEKATQNIAVMISYGDQLPAKLGDLGIPTISCAICGDPTYHCML